MRVGRQVAARVVAHEQHRALGRDAVEPAHVGAEVEAREHPEARERLADVVGVALVEVGLRDARLGERGDGCTTREPSSTARQPPFRAARAGRRRWATRRWRSALVVCVLSRSHPSPVRLARGPGAYARAPICGQVSGGPSGRASLCGSPAGRSRSSSRDARLAELAPDGLDRRLDHAVAVARRHQVGAHHGVVLVRGLDEDDLRAGGAQHLRLAAEHAAGRAAEEVRDLVRRIPGLRRMERRGRVEADDEVGRLVAEDVEVRGGPHAAVDVALAGDRDRAVEAGDRARGGDGVARSRPAAHPARRTATRRPVA